MRTESAGGLWLQLKVLTKQLKFIGITLAAVLILWSSGCRNTGGYLTVAAINWKEGGDASWQFENGGIIGRADGGTGWLMSEQVFSDYQLTLEFYPDSTINSGIFIRCADENLSMVTCYEINIWDHHPDQQNRTGAIVSRTQPLNHVETIGKWNTYRILARGGHIEAWINDIKVVDHKDETLPAGHIALQAAGTGEIRFRKVKYSELGD